MRGKGYLPCMQFFANNFVDTGGAPTFWTKSSNKYFMKLDITSLKEQFTLSYALLYSILALISSHLSNY